MSYNIPSVPHDLPTVDIDTLSLGGNYIDITAAPYSAIPDGSTDCTTPIQAAITAAAASGGKKIVFFPEPAANQYYKCAGQLDLSATDGVTLLGTAARVEPTQDRITTAIVYSGTASSFIKAGKSRGLTVQGLAIQNSSASFTGDLVTLDHDGTVRVTYSTKFNNCMIGGRTVAANNGRSGINMTGAVELFVNECVFAWSDYGSISLPSGSQLSYCNAINFLNNRFTEYGVKAMSIYGVKQGLILGNVFEFLFGTTDVAAGITDECVGAPSSQSSTGISIYSNGFWDTTSGVWINLRPYGADIRANYFDLGAAATAVRLYGGSGTRAAVGANRVNGTSGAKFIDVHTSSIEVLADDGSNVVDGSITYNNNVAATGYPDVVFDDASVSTIKATGGTGTLDGLLHARRSEGSAAVGGTLLLDRNDSTNWRGGALFSYFDSTLSEDTVSIGVSGDTTRPDTSGKIVAQVTEKGGLVLKEASSSPAAPGSNKGVLYLEDNGSGKTRLMIRFATGAAQQVAIEP